MGGIRIFTPHACVRDKVIGCVVIVIIIVDTEITSSGSIYLSENSVKNWLQYALDSSGMAYKCHK